MIPIRLSLFVTAILATVVPALEAADRYELTELVTAKGNAYDNRAFAIDSRGVVVGYTSLGHYSGGFSYFNGKFLPLGDLNSGTGDSTAYAINDIGQVVGDSFSPAGRHAFFTFFGGPAFDLGPANGESHAYGINNAGLVVGTMDTAQLNSAGTSYIHRAFVQLAAPYSQIPATYLGTLGGENSIAYGINDLSQIVGSADTADGTNHAFLYDGSSMIDLGTLGGGSSVAYAINRNSQIAGEAQTNSLTNPAHAFLRTGGFMQDLGTLGGFQSTARALNAHGDVVGSSEVKHSTTRHAFLFTKGKMTDLNNLIATPTSKLVLTDATGINDAGQITGNGFSPQNGNTAWILSPIPTLTITGGTNRVTHRSKITVHGRASLGIRQVAYRLAGHSRGHSVTGLAHWHLKVFLHRGKNVLVIIATAANFHRSSKIVTIVRS